MVITMETNSKRGFHLWIPNLELSSLFLYLVNSTNQCLIGKWSGIIIDINPNSNLDNPVYYVFYCRRRSYLSEYQNKKYNNRNNRFRNLSIVLAGFVIMQGIYNFAGALGLSLLAKAILEPLSFGILLFFGIMYLINRSKGKEEVKELQ